MTKKNTIQRYEEFLSQNKSERKLLEMSIGNHWSELKSSFKPSNLFQQLKKTLAKEAFLFSSTSAPILSEIIDYWIKQYSSKFSNTKLWIKSKLNKMFFSKK